MHTKDPSWWWTFGVYVAVILFGVATILRSKAEARKALRYRFKSSWPGRPYSYEFWVVVFVLSGIALVVWGIWGLAVLSTTTG